MTAQSLANKEVDLSGLCILPAGATTNACGTFACAARGSGSVSPARGPGRPGAACRHRSRCT
jgi:hypothetical protein